MSNPAQNELAVVLNGAGTTQITDHAFLRITGADAARWLNGMVSNSIQSLQPGEGCYSFLLNAQGHILGDCTVYREIGAEPAEFLLATTATQVETIQQHLDHFIIMDDVELTPAYADECGLLILGKDAASVMGRVELPAVDPLQLVHADTEHGPVLLLSPADGLCPKFELYGGVATITGLRAALGLPEVSAQTLEFVRLMEVRPLFGRDIRNTVTAHDLPQETAQTHALHFAKGCYLGQEIVERIRSRGQVHRQFMAFRLTGEQPTTLPVPLEAEGKPVGEITSAALVPLTEEPTMLALGYARLTVLNAGEADRSQLTYPGGVAVPRRSSSSTV